MIITTMRTIKKKPLWAAVLVAAGAIGILWATGHLHLATLAGLQSGKPKPKPVATSQPPAITVMRPMARKFTETLRVNGSLVAREEVLIAPQVDGQRIAELRVDAGATVAKGQLLARLATENLDALVAQSDANIARADAGIAQAQSSITQAEARLAESAAALARAKPLTKSGYLAQSVFDQRQATATSAKAALAIARDSLATAISEKAHVEAQRRELLWRRSRTDILAPVEGLILARAAKLGSIATAAAAPLFRIATGGEIELEAEVTSDQLHRVAPGQSVVIDIPGQPAITGTVRLLAPEVDKQTRLGHVRIFIGADPRLRVGTFASATIATAEGHGLAIASNAVMRDAEGPYVQIAVAGRIKIARLTLGLTANGYVEVKSGLDANDLVVAKAGTFLGPGDEITPIEQLPVKPTAEHAKAG